MFQTRNDSFEHGDLSALVCIDDPVLQSVVIDQLEQLGFGINTILLPEELDFRLHAHNYELIVTTEHFAASDAETNPVLAALRALSLDERRHSFVILIGPGMESRSEMQAFLYSVNLTLRPEEIGDLKTIAGRGIVRHEAFYSAFFGVRKSVLGK